MKLQELIQQKDNLNYNMLNYLIEQITSIQISAENMTECATNIKGQGYISFIDSRNLFLSKIDNIKDEIRSIINNRPTIKGGT